MKSEQHFWLVLSTEHCLKLKLGLDLIQLSKMLRAAQSPAWLMELSLSRNLCLPSHDCIGRLQRTQGPWYFLVVLD